MNSGESKPREGEPMISSLEKLRRPPLSEPLPPHAERKSIRQRYGVTQQELAELLGVSRLSLSDWERGKSEPSSAHARRYAQALREMKEALEREEPA